MLIFRDGSHAVGGLAVADILLPTSVSSGRQLTLLSRPGASWNATTGWDPVTGHGTPDFGKLLKLATKGKAGGYAP